MKAHRGMLSLFALIVANLYPLAGVFFLHWDATAILLLYFAENVIVLFYGILKMVLARNDAHVYEDPRFIPRTGDFHGREVPVNTHSKWAMIHCFGFVYGGFCVVHGVILLALIAYRGGGNNRPAELSLPLIKSMVRPLTAAILCLFLSHGVSFVRNYLAGGEYRRLSLLQLFYQPFRRTALLQVAVVGGIFGIMRTGGIAGLAGLLIVLKTVADITLHLRSHRRRADTDDVSVEEEATFFTGPVAYIIAALLLGCMLLGLFSETGIVR